MSEHVNVIIRDRAGDERLAMLVRRTGTGNLVVRVWDASAAAWSADTRVAPDAVVRAARPEESAAVGQSLVQWMTAQRRARSGVEGQPHADP